MRFYEQFKQPTGFVGGLVGHLMALKNEKRGAWVLSLLNPRAGQRVLEVGFGPGADARRVIALVGEQGELVGVDASEVMVRQASKRNRGAIAAGHARFLDGTIDNGLAFADGEFDAAFSINCAQFWDSLEPGLAELARVLKPGGRLVVAVQPRNRGATTADSTRWGDALALAARAAGLRDVDVLMGPAHPPVAAVRARKP